MTHRIHVSDLPRTKIVCTLGPASSSKEVIEGLIDAGMNVARLNFSHGEHSTHAQNIAFIREISSRKGKPVAILQDLQGPKIRTGKLQGAGMTLVKNQRITLSFGIEQVSENVLPIDYRELASDTHVGARILIDDGLMAMKVIAIHGQDVECEVTHGGLVKSRKGVNFPDCTLSIPSTTDKDTRDLLFGVSQNVDYVALSFVRFAADVNKLKSMLRALGADIPVIAKIEMLSAVENIVDIANAADAIMVARGDLGVECGFPFVAAFQKRIVSASRACGKPVIVATQMLDSMIENNRPTKAEICDVGNAVFDQADATMLSGETASGRHPVHVVETMRDILNRVDDSPLLPPLTVPSVKDTAPTAVPEVCAHAAAQLAAKCDAKAIVCLTLTGRIARNISKYRPRCPIIALSPRPDVVRKLSLVRGVASIQNALFYDTDMAIQNLGRMLAEKGLVDVGDLLVITGGIPLSHMAPTNLIKLHRVSQSDLEPVAEALA